MCLPSIAIAMLPKNIATVLASSVSERKGWFILVRKAREKCGDQRTEDKFTEPKIRLRVWVSLIGQYKI